MNIPSNVTLGKNQLSDDQINELNILQNKYLRYMQLFLKPQILPKSKIPKSKKTFKLNKNKLMAFFEHHHLNSLRLMKLFSRLDQV